MITYIRGKLVELGESFIVIETNGIGYEIFCNGYTFEVTLGKEEKIYIYEHIKEDSYDLYGFKTKEDKELFKKLISVSGIGPKGGMQILNKYATSEVIGYITQGDTKALSKVSGIGPKTAQRLVLELKDSLAKLALAEIPLLQTGKEDYKEVKEEAIEALMILGYGQNESKKAVEALFEYQDTSEKLIKKALSLLG
ncbi:Holliday junction branch migration protein RuvA [Sporanaerobium hydrogeniformans]|uniref:Holliday junction branch migration protein RuvA n=1 Tax=Sporanaerobium hydrogeniformans TaxID=3072179 RepID=A0AC61DE96_9FIRM|nr:Holliday junction branch migration protein RuvA [Sporanaerobium hydrogeniformans]PHV71051.1 Holliday junction branch migration protein RuvA [Sporanaerobium hydrogeniformans]